MTDVRWIFLMSFISENILDKGSQYYQKPTTQSVSANTFIQTMNTNNGVFQPLTVSTDPTYYQVNKFQRIE